MIQGFQKQTLIDYPDKIASAIFLAGCNFKCKFCHNKDLVLKKLKEIKEQEIIDYLKNKQKWIDAVVITGGEPTLYNLKPLIQKIKQLNYLIKLDTNGSNPEKIKEILPKLDYIAMDVKTSLQRYPEITGYNNIENIKQSIELIKSSNTPYEFRATVLPDIFDEKDAEQVGQLLKGTKLFVLQTFQPNNTLDPEYLNKLPYSPKQMEKLKTILEKYIQKVIIR